MNKSSDSPAAKTKSGAACQTTRLVLASTSPRRHELIKHLRLPFEIVPSAFEEVIDCALAPTELVLTLAEEKAKDVFYRLHKAKPDENLIVLGADTMVILDGKFLGKPESEEDAFKMLKRLSGRRHEVYTGVVLVVSDKMHDQPTIHRATEVSQVFFRELADDEIQTYIKTKEPMDKAGAYALQGTGSAFVQKINGCFTNIIGLPIPKVVSLLREVGIGVLGRTAPLD